MEAARNRNGNARAANKAAHLGSQIQSKFLTFTAISLPAAISAALRQMAASNHQTPRRPELIGINADHISPGSARIASGSLERPKSRPPIHLAAGWIGLPRRGESLNRNWERRERTAHCQLGDKLRRVTNQRTA